MSQGVKGSEDQQASEPHFSHRGNGGVEAAPKGYLWSQRHTGTCPLLMPRDWKGAAWG